MKLQHLKAEWRSASTMPGVLSVIRFLVHVMHKLSVANWALNGRQVSYYELYIAVLSIDSYTNCYEKR